MLVKEAREAARQWVIEQASGLLDFRGAYTAGSTNWLPEDAALAKISDFDIVVVLADPNSTGRRETHIHRDILLDVSYLGSDELTSCEQVLSHYHLAPSFCTATILLDPSGHFSVLQRAASSQYANRKWVRKRCAHARNRVVEHLRSGGLDSPLHDQITAWLFAAGVTTHILLAAGLRNPTVRTRYLAVRELLVDCGRLEFYEELLELLGCDRIPRTCVEHHLAMLTSLFDAAKEAIKTRFPFRPDIGEPARPMAIEGSRHLVERGHHREAMFWIAVTFCRCYKVLDHDATAEVKQRFSYNFGELVGDLGVPSSAEVQRRCREVERFLPRVWELAETIMPKSEEAPKD
jgi:hypothetical protein